MSEISEYSIVTKKLKEKSLLSKEEYTEEDFSELINTKIKEGWQPIGGVAIGNFYNGSYAERKISQAIVKYK